MDLSLSKSNRYQFSIKTILGWVFLLISTFVLPIATLRPNRIMAGVPYSLYHLIESHMTAAFGAALSTGVRSALVMVLMIAFLSILGVYTFIGIQERSSMRGHLQWMSFGLALIPTLLLMLLSNMPIDTGLYDPSVIRMSLSSGFWLMLIAILLIQTVGPATKLVAWLTGLAMVFTMFAGWAPELSLYKEYLNVKTVFAAEFIRHTVISISAVALAILPSLMFGYLCYKHTKLKSGLMQMVNVFQIIPTLSLLGLVMLPLAFAASQWPILNELGIRGIGFAPALIVLVLYGLLPITANTLAGFEKIDPLVIESASAMGLSKHQLFWTVLLPLAAPIMLSGIRIALTQTIGNAILAGLIGGGGLGSLIFLGLSQSASDLVILGTIPVVFLALISDATFETIEKWTLRKAGVGNDRIESSQ